MIYRALRLPCVLATLLVHVAAPASGSESPTGRWNVTVHYVGGAFATRMTLDSPERSANAGRFVLTSTENGKAVQVCLREFASAESCTNISLRTKGSKFQGNGELQGAPLTIEGQSIAVRPSGEPQVHVFEPQVFQQHYSSAAQPVLRIFPGDTVRTKTLDSEGADERGVRRSLFINPQTGPFYVEGAMPGDTLVVRFNSIKLNRSTADMFSSSIVAHALQPDYVRNEVQSQKLDSAWRLDVAQGIAQLANPSPKLRNFAVELQPMLGCVGVAPPENEAIVGYDLGVFGGNLDYFRIVSGATVYLPVFAPGALLFMGDAHARQGHAELTGTGLETSAAVDFTVELIEGSSLGQVRVEDHDYVMLMGVGGSLSGALQSATTGMTRWLAATYGLSDAEIALVLGSSLEYDIAEIVDPHVNVVARINRSVLRRIGER